MLGASKPGQTKRDLNKFAKNTGKNIGRIGVGLSVLDIGLSMYEDGGFGENTAGSIGAATGGWLGAEVGASVGGTIGSFCLPGVGTAIGAGIGAIIGGFGGGLGGGAAGKEIFNLVK